MSEGGKVLYVGKAQNLPQGRDENRYQLVNMFTYSLGTHAFKAGADISLIRADSFFPRNVDGNFQFRTDAPFDPNDFSTYPFQYSVAILDPYQDLPNDLYSFFAQDSWRARDNLTFNIGLRYDRERGFHKILGVPDDGLSGTPIRDVVPVEFRGKASDNAWSSCASCHPDGLSDNVTWIFATGPRRSYRIVS